MGKLREGAGGIVNTQKAYNLILEPPLGYRTHNYRACNNEALAVQYSK